MTISEINKSIPNTLLKCQFKLYNVNVILLIGERNSGKTMCIDSMKAKSIENKSIDDLYFYHNSNKIKTSSTIRYHKDIMNLRIQCVGIRINSIFVDEIFEISDEEFSYLVDYIESTKGTIIGTGYLPKRGTILYKLLIQHYPELVL